MVSILRSPMIRCVTVAVVLASGCARQKEPAQHLISDIQTAIDAAGPDAAKYVPDQLKDAESKLGELKADYDKRDYKAVVSGGPKALSEAQGLAAATTAKRDQAAKALNDQWQSLAEELPGDATAISERIDFLSQKQHRKLATGVDLAEAKTALNTANSLWAEAKARFSGGHLDQAVTAGQTAKTQYQDLAASMKLDLAKPAAVQDTSDT